jgi:hypothetical protein
MMRRVSMAWLERILEYSSRPDLTLSALSFGAAACVILGLRAALTRVEMLLY